MGSDAGERDDQSDEHEQPDGVVGDWGFTSRRKFLVVVIAAVTGALSTISYILQNMFGSNRVRRDASATGPDEVFVQQNQNGYEATRRNGQVITSGRNGRRVLSGAIDTMPAGGQLFVRGDFELNSPIEIEKSVKLDGSNASITLTNDADTAFSFAGDERYETELAESAASGTDTIELDSTDDIQQGDLVLLEASDGEPVLGRGQPAGEPHTVLEVDGSSVRLEDTIVWRDGYDSGTLAYVVDPIEVGCRGFDLSAPAKDETYVGVIARGCRNSTFADLTLDRFGSRAIAIEGAANARIRDCTIRQSADIEESDGYGIQIRAGCHDVVVEGCTAKECRHPLSVTPAGPREVASRSLIFRDCFVSATGSAALNCHGGSAHDVRFEECVVHADGDPGVRSGAQKTSVAGCEFHISDHHAITTRNDGQDMMITVSDTDIHGSGSAVELKEDDENEMNPSWELVHLNGVRASGCNRFLTVESGQIDSVQKLLITGCQWDTVGDEGIRLNNRIDGGTIEGNDFGDAPNESHIRVRTDSDSTAHNLQITGNRFQRSDGDYPFVRLADATQCSLSNNKFDAETAAPLYTENSDAGHNILTQNIYYGPGAGPDSIELTAGSLMDGNHFFDTENAGWS